MRLLRNSAILLVVMGLVLGAVAAPVASQEQRGDTDGDGCLSESEVPEFLIPPERLAGPPATLADPNDPLTDVGPSMYRFTLSDAEALLSACETDDEAVRVEAGTVALTVTEGEGYVTFAGERPVDQCEPIDQEQNQRTCLLSAQQTVTLVAADSAYHPANSRYQYVAEEGANLEAPATAQNSSTNAYAVGGVRAAGAPLAQRNAVIDVIAKGSRPRGCTTDCL